MLSDGDVFNTHSRSSLTNYRVHNRTSAIISSFIRFRISQYDTNLDIWVTCAHCNQVSIIEVSLKTSDGGRKMKS